MGVAVGLLVHRIRPSRNNDRRGTRVKVDAQWRATSVGWPDNEHSPPVLLLPQVL
jgi:hypothetical protein